MTTLMRVLVAFVVLVVIPCVSAVGTELTDGQAKANREPQTVEPPPARGLPADELGRVHVAQQLQDEDVDANREPHPHSLFIAIHPVSFFTHVWVHLTP